MISRCSGARRASTALIAPGRHGGRGIRVGVEWSAVARVPPPLAVAVQGDAREPGAKGGLPAKEREVTHGAQPGFLHQIGGVGRAPGEAAEHGKHGGGVPRVENAERRFVLAFQNSAD